MWEGRRQLSCTARNESVCAGGGQVGWQAKELKEGENQAESESEWATIPSFLTINKTHTLAWDSSDNSNLTSKTIHFPSKLDTINWLVISFSFF